MNLETLEVRSTSGGYIFEEWTHFISSFASNLKNFTALQFNPMKKGLKLKPCVISYKLIFHLEHLKEL